MWWRRLLISGLFWRRRCLILASGAGVLRQQVLAVLSPERSAVSRSTSVEQNVTDTDRWQRFQNLAWICGSAMSWWLLLVLKLETRILKYHWKELYYIISAHRNRNLMSRFTWTRVFGWPIQTLNSSITRNFVFTFQKLNIKILKDFSHGSVVAWLQVLPPNSLLPNLLEMEFFNGSVSTLIRPYYFWFLSLGRNSNTNQHTKN